MRTKLDFQTHDANPKSLIEQSMRAVRPLRPVFIRSVQKRTWERVLLLSPGLQNWFDKGLCEAKLTAQAHCGNLNVFPREDNASCAPCVRKHTTGH